MILLCQIRGAFPGYRCFNERVCMRGWHASVTRVVESSCLICAMINGATSTDAIPTLLIYVVSSWYSTAHEYRHTDTGRMVPFRDKRKAEFQHLHDAEDETREGSSGVGK
jgi:hypothetical protein